MSLDALRWALRAKVGKASWKLVLVSLADRANESHQAYPSIKRMADDTELDRKTIMKALSQLEALGLIQDTGERVGRTGRVPVYMLVGVEGREDNGTENGTVKQSQNRDHSKVPETGPFEGNGPAFPTPTVPKAGRLNGTKNGTLNLPVGTTHKNRKSAVGIDRFLADCKEAGEKAIPESDPVFTYAEETGIPLDYLRLCWLEFVDRHREKDKRQKDWRQTFRNCVRGNWYRLWFIGDDGRYGLTTVGKQAEAKHGREQ